MDIAVDNAEGTADLTDLAHFRFADTLYHYLSCIPGKEDYFSKKKESAEK